jgi:hypothetical protein
MRIKINKHIKNNKTLKRANEYEVTFLQKEALKTQIDCIVVIHNYEMSVPLREVQVLQIAPEEQEVINAIKKAGSRPYFKINLKELDKEA